LNGILIGKKFSKPYKKRHPSIPCHLVPWAPPEGTWSTDLSLERGKKEQGAGHECWGKKELTLRSRKAGKEIRLSAIVSDVFTTPKGAEDLRDGGKKKRDSKSNRHR